jgi:hypothetical protein
LCTELGQRPELLPEYKQIKCQFVFEGKKNKTALQCPQAAPIAVMFFDVILNGCAGAECGVEHRLLKKKTIPLNIQC